MEIPFDIDLDQPLPEVLEQVAREWMEMNFALKKPAHGWRSWRKAALQLGMYPDECRKWALRFGLTLKG